MTTSYQNSEIIVSDAVPMGLDEAEWLDTLDMIGMHASAADLQAHLEIAPNPTSETALFLAESLKSRQFH